MIAPILFLRTCWGGADGDDTMEGSVGTCWGEAAGADGDNTMEGSVGTCWGEAAGADGDDTMEGSVDCPQRTQNLVPSGNCWPHAPQNIAGHTLDNDWRVTQRTPIAQYRRHQNARRN